MDPRVRRNILGYYYATEKLYLKALMRNAKNEEHALNCDNFHCHWTHTLRNSQPVAGLQFLYRFSIRMHFFDAANQPTT